MYLHIRIFSCSIYIMNHYEALLLVAPPDLSRFTLIFIPKTRLICNTVVAFCCCCAWVFLLYLAHSSDGGWGTYIAEVSRLAQVSQADLDARIYAHCSRHNLEPYSHI